MTEAALPLEAIRLDSGTQVRAAINEAVVTDYAEQMTIGAIFPPIAVFHDGSTYRLADGYHRYLAAKRTGQATIEANVHPGTRGDALWFALGANRTNGQPLTEEDKTHAVALAVAAWPTRLQREIAAQVGCAQSLVSRVAARESGNITSDAPRIRGRKLFIHTLRQAVSRRIAAGESVAEIRQALHTSSDTIASVRRELGIPSVSKSRAAKAARLARMRELALEGHTSIQIAAELGLSVGGCRVILRDAQVSVPADVVTRGSRHPESNRIMSQIVADAENLSAGANLIDFNALDPAQFPDWIATLRTAQATIGRFIKKIQERAHGEATAKSA